MGLGLKHQTPAELMDRFREHYRGADGTRALRMAAWLTDAMDAGDVTEAQARQAFGPTWGQVKARMVQMRVTHRAAKTARGE